MGTTSPDNIAFPNTTDPWATQSDLSIQASSVQTALANRQQYTYVWTNSSGRTGQTGMRNGDTGYQQDTLVLYTYNGSAWVVSGTSPWTAWTPTTTGITLGTGGTLTALYRYVGNKIECKFVVVFGTGMSMGTNPTFTLPAASETIIAPYTAFNGVGSCYIAGSVFPLFIVANNTSSTSCLFYALAAATSGFASVTPTVPATWASTSVFSLQFSYLPA